MQEIPWFAVIDPSQCFVLELSKEDWRIAVRVGSKQYVIDFGDEEDLSSIFVSESIAHIVYQNLPDVFAYLRSKEAKLVPSDAGQSFAQELQNFLEINWDDVPTGAPLQEREFDNGTWGIVTVLPEGEHLVLFTKFDGEAAIITFYQDQESAQKAITFLQFLEEAVPSGDEISSSDVLSQEDYTAGISTEKILADIEEIEYIEMGWLLHLHRGKKSCSCGSCRFGYVRRLDLILSKYDRVYGLVPSLLLNMVDEVEANWKARENSGRSAP